MKIGDKVRVKSLEEVLKIEGVEDYRDVDSPSIVDYMLECFGKEGQVISCHDENENCVVSFDGDDWEFKKEWLDPVYTIKINDIDYGHLASFDDNGVRVEKIVVSLEKDVDLYYKIKNNEEAKWFANILMTHGYLRDRDKFVESFDKGRDCLVLYNFSDGNKEYLLVKDNGTLETIDKVKYEPAKVEEIKNPTYDDLKPLFIKTNADRHRDLVNQIHDVYVDKNMKYGDAFAETIEKYGMISALTRMSDKFNRVEQFIVNGYEDSEESLKDSLLDLANYCLMTVMEIDKK